MEQTIGLFHLTSSGYGFSGFVKDHALTGRLMVSKAVIMNQTKNIKSYPVIVKSPAVKLIEVIDVTTTNCITTSLAPAPATLSEIYR
jgi:hypothetical protein